MRTEGFKISLINTTVLDVFINPAFNRHLEDGFNITKLNMTWNATKYSGKLLQLQLYFFNPPMVSSEVTPDKIVVVVRKPEYANYFMSKELVRPLHKDWWRIDSNIGKQMEPSDFNKAYQDGAGRLNSLMIVLMVFSIFLYVMT